jgi:peptide/nickel transport system substrate-binding protein
VPVVPVTREAAPTQPPASHLAQTAATNTARAEEIPGITPQPPSTTISTHTPTPSPVPVAQRGAWVDTIIFVKEPSAPQAISRLQSGDIDLYASAISDPDLVTTISSSGAMVSDLSYGNYDELTFNPVGPVFETTGQLNPFAVPRVREAMNWLIDREFIAEQIYGGLAVPRWHALTTISVDYTELAATARSLEAEYAYDKARAEQVIGAEMQALGADLVNGRWQYQGRPVEISLLIRSEDKRVQIGDYVGNQLEAIGFTVIRDYKTAAEASPIWLSGDPALGQFHIYTGGWVQSTVPRDQAGNFAYFYTDMGLASPLWRAYRNEPEFYNLALDLDNANFRTTSQRRSMMTRALELALQDSVRIWLVDRKAVTARRTEVQVATDIYGGFASSQLWPYTLRRAGEVGGSMRIAAPSILAAPWNPLNGSNWIFDVMIRRGIAESATNSDTLTGLPLAHRLERAEVTTQTGLPLRATEDWVSLEFTANIAVPSDAWIDWDASRQRFVTVSERHPGGLTALTRSVVYYPADLSDTVMWHDGNPLSIGDFVMGMILQFDRAQEASPVYDPDAEGAYNTFMASFRGVRILSQEPLIIETYSDNFQLDAELTVTTWWPEYRFGMAAWHNLALGLLAEANREAAFSPTIAEALGVEQLDYLSGPTLSIMSNQLTRATNQRYIPYQPTLGQFISDSEVVHRYESLRDWYRTHGHFWLGTGVFYLERALPAEGTLILQRNASHPDPANRWDSFVGLTER